MEVRTQPFGCLMIGGVIVTGVMTLGIIPLAIFGAMRAWPQVMDERGVTTRGGRRVDWSDVNKVAHLVTRTLLTSTEAWTFHSLKGNFVIVPSKLVDGERVLEYALAHAPARANQR